MARLLDVRAFVDQRAIGVQAVARNPDTTLCEAAELRVIQLDLGSL